MQSQRTRSVFLGYSAAQLLVLDALAALSSGVFFRGWSDAVSLFLGDDLAHAILGGAFLALGGQLLLLLARVLRAFRLSRWTPAPGLLVAATSGYLGWELAGLIL